MKALFSLALRNVMRHRMRSAMTLASIVFGVVALILAGGFIEDTIVEVGESTIHSYSGHLQVAKRGYFQFGTQRPEHYLIPDADALRSGLQRKPHVKDALLRISFSGLINNMKTDWPIVGEGVEPAKEAALGTYITLTAGRTLADSDIDGVMIGQGVAAALNLKPGDAINLLVSADGGAANTLQYEVVGVFQTFSKDFDARAVRIHLNSAQELLGTKGAHLAVVLLDSTANTSIAAGALAQGIGPDLELKTWIELNDFYAATVTLYQQQFGFLVLIIVVMLVLSVANTVNMGIFERIAEFGTMRALGNEEGTIVRLILFENFLLGLVGAFIGAGLGIYLAWQISVFGIAMPPPPNADMGYLSHILIVPAYVILACFIAVLSCVAAAYLPAHRVAKLEIAEALRAAV